MRYLTTQTGFLSLGKPGIGQLFGLNCGFAGMSSKRAIVTGELSLPGGFSSWPQAIIQLN
jgi:hypothetical protein